MKRTASSVPTASTAPTAPTVQTRRYYPQETPLPTLRLHLKPEPQKPDAVLPWQLLLDTYDNASEYLGSSKNAKQLVESGNLSRKYDAPTGIIPDEVAIFAEVCKRAWHPVRDRLNKEYFLTPYTKVSCGVKGFFAGPFMVAAHCSTALEVPVLSEVARIALVVPALLEFSQGIISMIKALYFKLKGDDVRANMYFRDGLTRLLLGPALLVTAALSVPIEFIRFFTRLGCTIVNAFRGANEPAARVGVTQDPSNAYSHDDYLDGQRTALPL